MKNRKNWLAVSALLIGSTLFNTAQAGQANNSLVIGTSQEPPNINDPWRTNNLVIATEITWFMEAHLIGKDDNGDLYPEIATRVPSLANGDYKIVKDAKGNVVRNSVTFSIRKDAKWSDGTAITPKDFQFWLKVEQDDRVPVPTREPWDKAKITVQDADTFTITFDPPYLFADQITSAVGLNPAPSAAMEKAWSAFDAATKNLDPKTGAKQITDEWNKFIAQFTTSRGLPKVVSGPFKPSSWRAGNSLVLTRNPNYWITPKGGADKYLQTVQYRFIADTNTLKVNILSGQLDALSYVGLTFDQAIEAQRSERGKYKTYFVPGATWEHVDIANAGPRAQSLGLTDKRVRQALLYSIDRDALVKALFQGKQPVSNTWVSPIGKLYKKDAKDYNYDAAKAKALFAAAGWKPGPDGILAKDGKKMSLNFSTTAGNKLRERVQQILQAQWKAVGVDVNIQNFPSTVVFSGDFAPRSAEGKWDLFMYAWSNDPSVERGDLWASQFVPNKENAYAGQNYPNFKNADYDKLWNDAKTEFDLSARVKLFDKMQAIWTDELPSLPLYFRANPYTKVPGLVNYTYTAYSLYPSWNAASMGWASRGAAETYTQK